MNTASYDARASRTRLREREFAASAMSRFRSEMSAGMRSTPAAVVKMPSPSCGRFRVRWWVAPPPFLSNPRMNEAEPCGSRSHSSVRRPPAAARVPRLIAAVVLPTPPFGLTSAIERATGGFLRALGGGASGRRRGGPESRFDPARPGHGRLGTVPADPTSPEWFRRALAVPNTSATVDVDGPIHYLAWGEPGARGLVFVHGGGAHAHWWTHVAATFAEQFRVLAVDLSGHGDSVHRERYALEQWTDEVMAVADAGAINGPPVVIGHSMGGFVTIATAARHADRLSGVIVCDSPVTEPDPEIGAYHLREAFGRPRTYVSVEEAVARFRTVPAQEHYLPYVLDDVTCRLALLKSEYGLVTDDIEASMYDALGRVTPIVEIPEAGHHAMLDQPLLLLTAIRTLLADWDHSVAQRRPGAA